MLEEGQKQFHLNDDAWHHVAVVFPSSADSLTDVVIYIDGIITRVSSTNDREIRLRRLTIF